MSNSERKVIEELRRLRLELDLTYDEFAVALGVSKRNLLRVLTEPDASMRERTRYRFEQFVARHVATAHEPQAANE